MKRYIGHGFLRDKRNTQTRIVTLRADSRQQLERRARRLLRLTNWQGYCLALYPTNAYEQLDPAAAALYTPQEGSWQQL